MKHKFLKTKKKSGDNDNKYDHGKENRKEDLTCSTFNIQNT